MENYRLVLIEWNESFHLAGWTELDSYSPSKFVCRSVGWLIHEDASQKVICPQLEIPTEPDDKFRGWNVVTIPAGAVVSLRELTLLPG